MYVAIREVVVSLWGRGLVVVEKNERTKDRKSDVVIGTEEVRFFIKNFFLFSFLFEVMCFSWYEC